MKHVQEIVPATLLVLGSILALHPSFAADSASGDASQIQASSAAVAGLTSTKGAGTVSVVSDPTLAEGRLVLKVVAYNATANPSKLSDENVKVFTVAGKAVAVMSLDRLIDEVRRSASGSGNINGSRDGAGVTRNNSGEAELGAYTGAGNPVGGASNPYTRATANAAPENLNPEVKKQIDGLKAAVLQPMSIAPSSASGGQIVTERIKFSRKDQKAVRVIVDFNGELHEFVFEVPPAR